MEACDEGSVESEGVDGVDEGGGGRAIERLGVPA
jgi:hypothetical protein